MKLSNTIGGIVHIIIGLVIEEGWALNDIDKKTSRLLLRLILVDYSDQKIESLVDEIEGIIDLFESVKKPQDFS